MSHEIIIKNLKKELPREIVQLSSLFPEDKPLYLVGGAVRDILLRKKPTDWDFTTAAKPDEIIDYVRNWADGIWRVGLAFGTVGVIKNGIRYEITTFRSDIYKDGSRKPEITFSQTIEEDLIRRDFTVNSMAYQINDDKLIDPFGGLKDLRDGLLRTPRSVELSFTEDPLRMLRAITFTSTLNFQLNAEVYDGLVDFGHLLKNISAERIADELSKILLSEKPSQALHLLFYSKLSDYFLPEFSSLDIEQPTGFHHKNVLDHTLMVVDNTSPDLTLRLAALLHDIAKPICRKLDGKKVHFYGHDLTGSKMTRKIMRRLKFSSEMTQKVSKLVKMHMRPHTYREGVWTDSAIRRYIREAGDILPLLNQLTVADCTSLNPKVAWAAVEKQRELERQIDEVLEKENIMAIKPLISGTQIMEHFNIKPGPVIGKIHKIMLEKQIDGELSTIDAAWKLAEEIYKEELKDEG